MAVTVLLSAVASLLASLAGNYIWHRWLKPHAEMDPAVRSHKRGERQFQRLILRALKEGRRRRERAQRQG